MSITTTTFLTKLRQLIRDVTKLPWQFVSETEIAATKIRSFITLVIAHSHN